MNASVGLVPIAIGADGGGSIRIPASMCGVVGLKGTFHEVAWRVFVVMSCSC